MTPTTSPKGFNRVTNILLIVLVIALLTIPFFLARHSEFGGSDDAAEKAITEISPTTQPWFHPLWTPPGSEIESLLFALQAALGASVLGYFFGYKRGQRRLSTELTTGGTVGASKTVERHARS